MKLNRRTFAKLAGGAAAAGVAGGAKARASTTATAAGLFGAKAVDSTAGGTHGSVDSDERRRLIAKAVFGKKELAQGNGGLVICAHPLATRAGTDVLRAGGNAADAALAASVTQTVVEPHMTGITGVLSTLYFDAEPGKSTYVNGGMNRPMADLAGWGPNALASGLGAAVPGFWAGYEATLERFGSKPSKDLCAAAIAYARDGFEIHPFLWGEMFMQANTLGSTDEGREIFFPDGAILDPGELLVQKRAAETLERLAEDGNDYFYRGGFAEEYCKVVQDAGGVTTREDFERYDVRFDEPAYGSYRDYQLVGSPPPDHGGTHIIEILQMIELLDLQKLGPVTDSPELLWQMARICTQVYNEGGRHRDPKYHPMPLEKITSKDYAQMRFDLLQMDAPLDDAPAPPPGSCHVTAVDDQGNVATILHSCMSLPWSNGLFAGGVTVVASGAHYFRVMPGPGERATVYVAPNFIMKNGRPLLASGSPSGSLLQNIVQNATNMLDFGMTIDESTARPRFGNAYSAGGGMFQAVEADFPATTREGAVERGLQVGVVNPWNFGMGSFEAIWIDPDTGKRSACGDPRRNAMAEAT